LASAELLEGFPAAYQITPEQGGSSDFPLIVVYESHSKMGYCAWLNQLVGADIDLLSAKRDNIQLRIPESRRVAPGLWPGLGHEVRGLTAALGRRVHAAERSFPILRFVHEISEALRLFDFVAENWAHRGDHQSEKAIFLHASEIVCHVNVVRAIFDLMEELPRELYSIQGLDDFATRWIESCEEFAPGFRSLVEYRQEGLLEHAMAMDIDFGSMCERRKGFVRSALDAQKQITSLGLGLTASDAPSE